MRATTALQTFSSVRSTLGARRTSGHYLVSGAIDIGRQLQSHSEVLMQGSPRQLPPLESALLLSLAALLLAACSDSRAGGEEPAGGSPSGGAGLLAGGTGALAGGSSSGSGA